MIEDPELTLKILTYFADDAVGFPANTDVQDLTGVFPDVPVDRLTYHVICAIDCGLLRGEYSQARVMEGAYYTVGFIDGLTQEGGEYVRATSNTKFLAQAQLISKALGSL